MRHKGDKGEEIACHYLQQHGWQILARNFHARYGEIDIIAKEKEVIVFVEVKAYQAPFRIHPLEVITKKKLKHMRIAAQSFLYRRKWTDVDCRLDLITVENECVSDHLKGIG